MCHKIQCDTLSWKFLGTKQDLNGRMCHICCRSYKVRRYWPQWPMTRTMDLIPPVRCHRQNFIICNKDGSLDIYCSSKFSCQQPCTSFGWCSAQWISDGFGWFNSILWEIISWNKLEVCQPNALLVHCLFCHIAMVLTLNDGLCFISCSTSILVMHSMRSRHVWSWEGLLASWIWSIARYYGCNDPIDPHC